MTNDHENGEQETPEPPARRDVQAFLCYRRNDGAWHAEWLNDHLDNIEYRDPDGTLCHLSLYYDRTAPGVANWKHLHFPSLQTSHALIVICTPGIAKDLSRRGNPDWVYEELRWWTQYRRTAPIVVDATGEGDRWLPELITRQWPDINRIDLRREDADAAAHSSDSAFAERIQQRIVGSIQQSERASVFEDLERSKRLTNRLKLWLTVALVSLVALAVTSGVTWHFYTQATNSLSELLEEQGRSELLFGDRFRAAVYLSESYMRGRQSDSVRSLLADAMRWVDFRLPPLGGHNGPLTAAEFAPDGSRFVTASDEGTAQVWDVSTRKVLHTLTHGSGISAVVYDPQGLRIASIGYDDPVKIWDVASGKELPALERAATGGTVQFTRAGDRLLVAGSDGIKVWDTQSGHLVAEIPERVRTATFDPKGLVIASVDDSDTAVIWDAQTGKRLHTLNHVSRRVYAVCFDRAGHEVITGGDDGAVYVWGVKTGKLRIQFGEKNESLHGRVSRLAISPQESHLATGTTDGTVAVWDLPSGRLLWKTKKHRMNVMDIAYDGRGSRIATAGTDGSAKLWDAATGALLADLVGHSDAIRAVRFRQDGDQLLTVSDDRFARLWNLGRLKLRATLSVLQLWNMRRPELLAALSENANARLSGAFADNGQRVVGTTPGNRVSMWLADTGTVERTFGEGVGELLVSNSGERLLSLDGNFGRMQARLWNGTTGEVMRTIGPHSYVDASFLAGDQRVVVTVSDGTSDDKLFVIDATKGEELWQLAIHSGHRDVSKHGLLVAIGSYEYGVSVVDVDTREVKKLASNRYNPEVWLSPDGSYLLTTSTLVKTENGEEEKVTGNAVEVWSVSSGALLGRLTGHTGGVIAVAFDSDGTRAATTSIDRSARVWDLERLRLVAKLEGHTGAIRSATFSPDGRRIATASEDGTARVWDAKTGRLLAILSGYSDWALTVPSVHAVLFDRDGDRLLAIGQALTVWDVGLERRDPEQIVGIVRREVPWTLVGGQLAPRDARNE